MIWRFSIQDSSHTYCSQLSVYQKKVVIPEPWVTSSTCIGYHSEYSHIRSKTKVFYESKNCKTPDLRVPCLNRLAQRILCPRSDLQCFRVLKKLRCFWKGVFLYCLLVWTGPQWKISPLFSESFEKGYDVGQKYLRTQSGCQILNCVQKWSLSEASFF